MSNLMLSDLIAMTREYVQGNSRSVMNTLSAEKASGSTTALLTYPITGLQQGQTVEIAWVEYQIMDLSIPDKRLELEPVVPGTAVTHAAGTRVLIVPRFATRSIIRELNADLDDLETNGIYKLRTVEATAGVITPPVDAVIILDAWNDGTDTSELHHEPPNLWRLGDDPDGVRLVGPQNVDFMVFGCTLGEFSYTADHDVSTTGLVNTAEDLPPMGAAIRLIAGRESQRNIIDSQGETRRATEVPAGSLTGALRNLAAIRNERVNAEARRIQQRYGLRLHRRV